MDFFRESIELDVGIALATLQQVYCFRRNRSGCQNLPLAIKASPVVLSGYGHASRITSRDLGPATTRSPGLYSGAGGACGGLGGHGAGVPGAELRVPGAAEPNL